MSGGQRTSDFYRTKYIPERFDNPGKLYLLDNFLKKRKKRGPLPID